MRKQRQIIRKPSTQEKIDQPEYLVDEFLTTLKLQEKAKMTIAEEKQKREDEKSPLLYERWKELKKQLMKLREERIQQEATLREEWEEKERKLQRINLIFSLAKEKEHWEKEKRYLE